METVTRIFPSQKQAFKSKGEDWGKECVEGAIQLAMTSDSKIRQYYYNKKKNYDLYNDIIDLKDVENVCSPLGFDMSSFPATMQNYPMCNPKIKLLVGEEQKRRFEWRVISTNPDNISKKEELVIKDVVELMMSELQAEQQKGTINETQLKTKLASIQNYYKYDYQDMQAKMASSLLNYYWRQQQLQFKFNRGFEDALIAGEEIYRIDVVQGEPIVTKCNPLNVFIFGNGTNQFIDESDIILEIGYHSFGGIVDEFHDELKENQIKDLESNTKKMFGGGSQYSSGRGVNYSNFHPTLRADFFSEDPVSVPLFDSSIGNTFQPYDANGNILVMRVTWKSKRKVGKLTFMDPNTGLEETKFVDENYPIDKLSGEKVKWMWVNEYWEGVKIGKDIYVRIQPKPVQFRSMNNPSKCKSGYVGAVYNVNENRGRSLYDQMKPYQYLFNIFMYRAELGFARFKFPVYEINTAMIPEGWETEKWLEYAEVLGYAFVDPFNEAKKGAAQGQLAGNFNTFGGRVMESKAVGDYIQSNIAMLDYIERQVGNISGVSEQRQGQISSNELVGNVERAVTQSSHITEPWFSVHEHVKLRVLETLLETAKYCLRNETDKRLHYVLDDLSIKTAKIDGQELAATDFDIFLTHSSKYAEFEQTVKQLAHAAMQNQMIGFKEIIQIYQANSIYDMTKVIENAEERKKMEIQESEEKQREHEKVMQAEALKQQQQATQYEVDKREDEQMHEILAIRVKGEEDRATKMLEASLQSGDEVNTEELDMKLKELEMKQRKQEEELDLKRQKLNDDKSFNDKKLEQDKELKEKQIEVSRIKKKSSSN